MGRPARPKAKTTIKKWIKLKEEWAKSKSNKWSPDRKRKRNKTRGLKFVSKLQKPPKYRIIAMRKTRRKKRARATTPGTGT